MKSLRHRLPPLPSLLVFEAAARTSNFTRAATELHVTQAAVSKQIRMLEEGLGFKLFQGPNGRVVLTPRGKQLQNKVSSAFNYLADAVEEIGVANLRVSVTLAANSAVSHYWLDRYSGRSERRPQKRGATLISYKVLHCPTQLLHTSTFNLKNASPSQGYDCRT
nr:LysR family transcriptional regulator [Caballeronia arvi]